MPRGRQKRRCACGVCQTCSRRAEKQRYYRENAERIRESTRTSYHRRKAGLPVQAEPDDSTLDQQALKWLEANGMR